MQHDAVKEGKAERAGATKEGEGKSRGTSEGDGGSGERAKKEFPEAPGESLLYFFYFLFSISCLWGSRFWGYSGTLVRREGRGDEMSLACFGCSGWDPDAWSERQNVGNSRARAALESSLLSQYLDFRQRLWRGGASVKPLRPGRPVESLACALQKSSLHNI